MKRRVCFYLLFVFFILPLCVIGQTPQWQWAVGVTQNVPESGRYLAIDHSGNVYCSAIFTGTISLDTFTLTSTGNTDIYLAKYTPTGQIIWARNIGYGPGQDQVYSIAVDISNSIYVAGTFYDSAYTTSGTILSNGFSDLSIAKYDSSGNIFWQKTFGSIYRDRGSKISTDENMNIYLTGGFASDGSSPPSYGTISFDNITLTSNGGGDIFLVKLNASGTVIWARNAGGVFSDAGGNLMVDRSGDNVYVTGDFDNPGAYFDNIFIQTKAGTFSDMFVAKYDSSGNVLWVQGIGGQLPTYGGAMAVDEYGNCFVSGTAINTSVSFGSIILSNDNSFVAKYNATGGLLWAKNIGYMNQDFITGMTMDNAKNIYLTGTFNFSGIFGPDTLIAYGGDDMFLLKMDSAGNNVWAVNGGGTSGDGGGSILLNKGGDIYTNGSFSGMASFGSLQLNSGGGLEMFLAKLSQPNRVVDVYNSSASITVYPNPSSGIINIKVSKGSYSTITVYNEAGAIVYTTSMSQNKARISLKFLPKGLYFLKFSGQSLSVTKKLTIH